MPTFTVQFFTDAGWSETIREAKSPSAAMEEARSLADANDCALTFESFEEPAPVVEIQVHDADGQEVAKWMHHAMRLRLAAPALLDAAKLTISRWEMGDLADAIRQLNAAVAEAEG